MIGQCQTCQGWGVTAKGRDCGWCGGTGNEFAGPQPSASREDKLLKRIETLENEVHRLKERRC